MAHVATADPNDPLRVNGQLMKPLGSNCALARLRTSFAVVLLLLTSSAGSVAAEPVGLRIRFGVGDRQTLPWDGSIEVSEGTIQSLEGWRFQQTDAVIDNHSWKAQTRRGAARRTNNPNRQAARANANANGNQNQAPVMDNGIVVSISATSPQARVSIKTQQGDFDFALSELEFGAVKTALGKRVEIERTASTTPIAITKTDDDFPAMASGKDQSVALAYIAFTPGLDRDERARSFTTPPADLKYLKKPAGGDQVYLRYFRDDKWSDPIAVTEPHQDVYKCAVAIDSDASTWVIWSANRENNFDIWARRFKGTVADEPVRLTSDAGTDNSPVATTDAQGKVWIAWQGYRNNHLSILTRHLTEQGWSKEEQVSPQSANCWSPAIAATPTTSNASDKGSSEVTIAWDTYEFGDYDVWMRRYDANGTAHPAQPIAATELHQARPAICYDKQGNLWCGWEESGATWGKNWGALVQGQGIPLYQDRQVALRVWDGKSWKVPASDHRSKLPDLARRVGMRGNRVRSPEPEAETRKTGEEAETAATAAFNNISRLCADEDGRIWLLVRTRQPDFRSPLGTVWFEYATCYTGNQWSGSVLLPHSDNLLYNYPAAIGNHRGLMSVHATDHRQDRHVQRQGGSNSELGESGDPFMNDLFASQLIAPKPAQKNELQEPKEDLTKARTISPAVQAERAAVERCRTYRAQVNGTELRILRGEFHRHTEISGDGGGDGALEDMWRYGIDVAAMDWIGNGDHDNGAGREYTWWLTQKTTDVFHMPGAFDPLFSYERSVRYPEGHRNVIFPYRGVRTLPRLPISDRDVEKSAPDTQLLYRYLREFGGVCASHTSATSMGTDWRDNDPEVEPFVEIYQGARQNYERPDAPRAPQASDSIGGWEPKGFVNLALKKGYRLSFESSSDHRSTHISYALVYAESASRQGIFEAMKKRHTYAATENIVADFRCRDSQGKDHFMGDEFTTSRAPEFQIKLMGTAPFKKVFIVKDDEYVSVTSPGEQNVAFTWTDPKPSIGKTSYYYVRGEQEDGELVWISPMWITVTDK